MSDLQYKVTIGLNNQQKTLKQQLADWYIPRRIRGALRMRKAILINGVYQHTNTILKSGDILTFNFLASDFVTPDSSYLPDDSYKLEIIYENNDLLVVNKPAGYKTHPNYTGEMSTVMNFAANYLKKENKKPYIVHRLDQMTSGALIIAKTPIVVPILNQLIANKVIKRTYLAWVKGTIKEDSGVIDLPIGLDLNDKRKRKVNGEQALDAITYFKKIHSVFQRTLIRLQLETGRTHQLRVHLQAMHHPIVGDPLYNIDTIAGEYMLLHSAQVELHIPFSDNVINLAAKLPTHFPVNLK